MGLLGLFVTVAIMAAASWYMLAGPSSAPTVIDNPEAPAIGQGVVPAQDPSTVSGAQALIGQANGLKVALEKKTADEVAIADEEAAPKAPSKSAEASKENKLSIIDKKVSFGFSSSSGRKIDTVVLHSSYDALGSEPYSVSGTIKEYGEYGVAPHYLIDRKGNIYRLVADKDIAYHAGESKMADGRTGVNGFSIGIELLNKEDDKYTDAQYAAVNSLIVYLKDLYPIKHVVGHDDIAPGRKTDPWNFDWKKVQ